MPSKVFFNSIIISTVYVHVFLIICKWSIFLCIECLYMCVYIHTHIFCVLFSSSLWPYLYLHSQLTQGFHSYKLNFIVSLSSCFSLDSLLFSSFFIYKMLIMQTVLQECWKNYTHLFINSSNTVSFCVIGTLLGIGNTVMS